MSDVKESTQVETTPVKEEMVSVVKPLEKTFDVLSQANTVFAEKDTYSESHRGKILSSLYQSIEEGTGIPHPSRIEAEALRKDLETSKASLDASKGELDTLSRFKVEAEEKLKALETSKTELETQLGKYKDAKFGKFDDKEGTVKVQDHQSTYDSLKRDNKHIEASDYYRKYMMTKPASK